MIRYLADENFNNQIIRGVQRRLASVVFVRVQDTNLFGHSDPQVLTYATQENCILLSHDVNTMRGYFYERLAKELEMPALFLVHSYEPIGAVIDSLTLIAQVTEHEEWVAKITYLPLR